VVSQRLIARADGSGMIPAVEVLVSTAHVRELIGDPSRTRELHDAIATGRDPHGMIGFDDSILDLVRRDLIRYEAGLSQASNPDDFALRHRKVARDGHAVVPPGDIVPEAELRPDDDRARERPKPSFTIERLKR